MGPYDQKTFEFEASGSAATLTFTSTTLGSCGAVIDSVSVIGPDAPPPNGCGCDDFPNHGQYVSCVVRVAEELEQGGLITGREAGKMISTAAQTSCGKSNKGKARGR